MTTHEIARRMRARETAPGRYIAKCPKHNDRRASLTIGEGRDGKTLIHCWAGCATESVLASIGLSLRDLFDGTQRTEVPQRVQQRPSEAEIRLSLALEADRVRKELERRGILGELLTDELNDIRRRVGARTGAALEPLHRSPYEGGGFGGRDRDPLWPLIFEAAWHRVCVAFYGAPLPTLQEFADASLRPPSLLLVLAEDLAACLMREEEHVAAQRRRRIAAA
jgi:hypothetical protein